MTTTTTKSSPHMSFAQTYILASKVRSKLTKEAASPKSSLRNLVVQANMLDNLMDYITEETERRNNYNQEQHQGQQQDSDGKRVQFDIPSEVNHGKSGHSDEEVSNTGSLYKTSITEYELDSDSDSDSDSDYEEEDYDDGDEQEEGDVSDEIKQLNGAIYEHAAMIPHVTTQEVTDSDSEDEEEEIDNSSSIYSSSGSSDSDSDDYYIYSDSEEVEEDVATQAKIPRTIAINTSMPSTPSYKSLPFTNLSSSTPTIIEEDEDEEEEEEEEGVATDVEESDDEGTIICDSDQQEQIDHLHHDMPELCNTNSLTDDEYDDEEYLLTHPHQPHHHHHHHHHDHHNSNAQYTYPSKTLEMPTNTTTTSTSSDGGSNCIPISLFQHENLTLEQIY
ncbi:hypothetical protein CORT_0G02790 [Candida orthopsilosis Co 90-125]|uniref:Uncharacterized protein n=1 Tax=Candida orthopsilosis (strain 90-125) TaxID=1136231 RepID=H8XAV7_CANO9|nr:hypothetical protein CORT_0G02790 [Candida orthopsilosis Co 90-125]CCG24958.1 hypothetical protein CORT_0G02790 [Candida orthopsilosis Co 90-125]